MRRMAMGMQQTLRALADPTRREILTMLKGGRMPAGAIADCFEKYIYYELNASVLEEIMLWLAELQGGRNHD